MFKLAGIIMIVLSCGGYVFSRAQSIKEKCENLRQIKQAITYIKHEMSFSAPQIDVLAEKCAQNTKGEVSEVFSKCRELLDKDKTLDFYRAWHKAKANRDFLSEEADNVVCEFFKNLGKKSIEIELDNIKKTEEILAGLLLSEEEKTKKDAKLTYTLGGAVSAAVIIFAL
jgi:stage III sporulation protein AB